MTSNQRKESKKSKDKISSKSNNLINSDIVILGAEDILKKSSEKHYADVYSLDLSSTGINRIANLEKFIKLRVLDLSRNKLEWIDGLERNQELRELKLYSNRISEISGLEKLKGLTNLILQFNNISEMGSGLKSLRALKVLRLDNNKIKSVEKSALSSCSNLSSLDLSNNYITDITNICCLKSLTELRLANNAIERLPDIFACKSLADLDISNNYLTDIGSLSGLHVLNSLNISRNKIRSLEALGKLGRLQELRAANNLITSISGGNIQFPIIEVLDIQRNQISSIEELESLKLMSNITELLVTGNPVESSPEYKGLLTEILKLPSIEILNKKQQKNKVSQKRPGSAVVIMRKMSEIESKEVEELIRFSMRQLQTFENSVEERFTSIRNSINELLPERVPISHRSISPTKDEGYQRPFSAGQRPASRSGRISRLQEAMAFASENITETTEQIS